MSYRIDDDHPHVDWRPRDKDPLLMFLGRAMIVLGLVSLMWVVSDGADGRIVGSAALIGIGVLLRRVG